jgi:hypothetical protein
MRAQRADAHGAVLGLDTGKARQPGDVDQKLGRR